MSGTQECPCVQWLAALALDSIPVSWYRFWRTTGFSGIKRCDSPILSKWGWPHWKLSEWVQWERVECFSCWQELGMICLVLCCSHIIVWSVLALHVLAWALVTPLSRLGPETLSIRSVYKFDELELQYAVAELLYPPTITLQVVQSEVPRHLQSHKHIHLHVHGPKEGAFWGEGSCVLTLHTHIAINTHTTHHDH